MALEKDFEVKGITCNYWKILTAINSYLPEKTKIVLGVYPSKTVRDADINNHHDSKTVLIDGVDMAREAMYTAIKVSDIVDEVEQNFFADAVDSI